jgi:hypothetical protein
MQVSPRWHSLPSLRLIVDRHFDGSVDAVVALWLTKSKGINNGHVVPSVVVEVVVQAAAAAAAV